MESSAFVFWTVTWFDPSAGVTYTMRVEGERRPFLRALETDNVVVVRQLLDGAEGLTPLHEVLVPAS